MDSVGGVMVLVLSTMPDVLYLYRVLSKYLIGFQSYGPEQKGRPYGGGNLQRGIIL